MIPASLGGSRAMCQLVLSTTHKWLLPPTRVTALRYLGDYLACSVNSIIIKVEASSLKMCQGSTWVVSPCEAKTMGSLSECLQKGSGSGVMIARHPG